MSNPTARRESDLPSETVWGNEIDYVWVVYRPARESQLGKAELLSAYTDPEDAEKHAKIASREGACQIKEMPLTAFGNDADSPSPPDRERNHGE